MGFCEHSVVLLIILVIFSDIAFCDNNVLYRLPNDTAPMHYHIQITTELEKGDFKFSGVSTITIKVLEETEKIVLHSKLGRINGVEVLSPENENIFATFENAKANEFLTITVKQNLRKQHLYTLTIWYSSKLRSDKLGFYRDSYIDNLGRKVWLAATQFAPAEARHAFPCYDEPNRKATFELEITYPSKLSAISNRKAIDKKINTDGTSTTKFQKTEIISPQLVGFLISNFEKVIVKDNPKVHHEVYISRPNRALIAAYSANCVKQLWFNLTNHFTEEFPEDVIKHIALPNSYFSGTANRGFITYREREFMFDSLKYTMERKLKVISLIGQELAHSWFGNLVTEEWWTYNWLSEGFSTLYGYYAAEMGWPYSNFLELFVVEKMFPVFKVDGTENTRPITHYIEKPSEIIMSYDKIASNKAACVLRMLEHAFGRTTFKTALNKYLQKKKFQTANENDLIDCLSEVMPEKPRKYVEDIIKSWTSQKGYPVITITRDYDASSIKIEQERFMYNGDVDKVSLWRIPINFEKANESRNFTNTSPDIWMTERTLNLKGVLPNGKNASLDPTEWIIFNKAQTGYYRVNYDQQNWELIIQALKDNYLNIDVLNRAQLIDNSFSLATAGKLNYSVPLKLISYMRKEPAYSPWGALNNHIKDLKRHLSRSKVFVSFSKYLSGIARAQIKEMRETNGGDSLIKLTSTIVLNLICEFNITQCPVEGKEFAENPELRSLHYCHKMHKYGNLTYVELRNILRVEDDFYIRRDILSSFGCAQTKGLLSFFLSSTIEVPSDLMMTNDERVHLLKSIYQKGEWGLNITIAFIAREWKSIDSILPELLDEIVPDMAKYVNSYAVKKMFNFMVSKIKMLKPTTLAAASTEITNNLRWLLVNEADVETFLKSSSVNHFISLCIIILFSILTCFI